MTQLTEDDDKLRVPVSLARCERDTRSPVFLMRYEVIR